MAEFASDLMPAGAPRLVLASASPRRRELIALFGLPFEVVPSRYVESPPPAGPIDLVTFVRTLATHKAQEVATRTDATDALLILGADTLVTLTDGPIGVAADGAVGVALGKPADTEDARRMLRLLSGNLHTVYTGIALIYKQAGAPEEIVSTTVGTRVRFRTLSDTMIDDYVATGEPMDKAGAYGAQGYAAPFIEGFEGDFFNVVGLPLCAVGHLLERLGVPWWRFRQQTPPRLG